MTSNGVHNRPAKGYLQDAERFRPLIGENEWNGMRFFETVVETTKGRSEFRFMIVCSSYLFLFEPGNLGNDDMARAKLWNGSSKHPPIHFTDIQNVELLKVRPEVFAVSTPHADSNSEATNIVHKEDHLNENARHIKITCVEHRLATEHKKKEKKKAKKPKAAKSIDDEKQQVEEQKSDAPDCDAVVYPNCPHGFESEVVEIELLLWESHCLAYFNLHSAWINSLTVETLNLVLGTGDHLDNDSDTSELYTQVSDELLKPAQVFKSPAVYLTQKSSLVHEIAQEILHNQSFKRLYFSRQSLWKYCLKEMESYYYHDGNYQRAPKVIQLQYVLSLFQMFQCALFNCATVHDCRKLLNPLPYNFTELIIVLTRDYSFKGTRNTVVCDYPKNTEQGDNEEEIEDETEDSLFRHDTKDLPLNHQQLSTCKRLLQSIAEVQVGILVSLSEIVTWGIFIKDRNVYTSFPETFASCVDALHRVPVYVHTLVELLEEYTLELESGGAGREQVKGGLAVRIYQHAKLLHGLVLGDYRNREFIQEECGDEVSRKGLLHDIRSFSSDLVGLGNEILSIQRQLYINTG